MTTLQYGIYTLGLIQAFRIVGGTLVKSLFVLVWLLK